MPVIISSFRLFHFPREYHAAKLKHKIKSTVLYITIIKSSYSPFSYKIGRKKVKKRILVENIFAVNVGKMSEKEVEEEKKSENNITLKLEE